MSQYDLKITHETFKTEESYELLANKMWVHTSLGGHIFIENCTFDSSVLTNQLCLKLNEMIGFKFFNDQINLEK